VSKPPKRPGKGKAPRQPKTTARKAKARPAPVRYRELPAPDPDALDADLDDASEVCTSSLPRSTHLDSSG
jgi:hypothetical protein